MIRPEITFKNINKIAVPALLASIAEPLLSSTDAAVVGNLETNATEALAAVGIVGAFLSMLIWILGQTRSAISALISQHLGADKLLDIKSLPAQAIFFNIVLSIIVLASTSIFIKPIFQLLNAEGQVLNYCIQRASKYHLAYGDCISRRFYQYWNGFSTRVWLGRIH